MIALPAWLAESSFNEYNATIAGVEYANLHGGPSFTKEYTYVGIYLVYVWKMYIALLCLSSTLYIWMYLKTRRSLKEFSKRSVAIEHKMLNTAFLMFFLNFLFVIYFLLR